MVVEPASVRACVRASIHIFKDFLLRNRLADQSQILCGASMGKGNESLCFFISIG